jgi:hypothetical protein
MTVSKVFVLHGFNTETNSRFFSQLEQANLNTNVEDMTVLPSGHVVPMFTAENGSRPEVAFSTHQVETALAEFGLLGADPGNVELFLKKVTNRGSRVANATAEHVQYLCNSVLGYITQITAGANKHAVCSGRLALLNDGTNAAIIYSGSTAITDSPTGGENFVLGPIGHNGTAITGTDNLTIDLGVEVIEPEQEILSEPTFAAVDSIKPTITFDTTDATVWSTLHRQAITNGMKLNLLKKKPDLDRYADGDTEHILFTVAKGRAVCESVSGDKSITKVKIYAVSSDGLALPVTATVDSAVDITALV